MFLLIIITLIILIIKPYNTYSDSLFSACLLSLLIILIFFPCIKCLPLPSSTISETETANIQALSKADYQEESSYVWVEDSEIKHLPEARTAIVYSNETTITTNHKDYPFWLDCILFPLNFLGDDTYIISIPKEAIL